MVLELLGADLEWLDTHTPRGYLSLVPTPFPPPSSLQEVLELILITQARRGFRVQHLEGFGAGVRVRGSHRRCWSSS